MRRWQPVRPWARTISKIQTPEDEMQITELKLPQLLTSLPGPKAKKIVELDHQFVSPSYTRDYPLVAKFGRGATIEDVDGNTFLDFAAGIAVVATGHCHPEVVAAIQKQAAELMHMSGTDFYYPNMSELAQKLASIAPGKDEKLVAFHGAFHGRTMGALSLTASRAVQRKGFGTLLSGVFHMPYPDTYRGTYGIRPEHASADCLSYLENELFRRRVDPDEVAGIFIEPIQGEGGYLPAPADFLQGLQRICRKYGILLVADEVQSGMGRTGKWWASDHAGIEPDIICTAKGIASGMPLSAIIARADVMNWVPGAHASTFGGNPVCIVASLATIGLLERNYIANAAQMGEFIRGLTADWTTRHKIVGEVRGKGLMIGIEIVRDQKTKERAPDLRNRLVQMAFHKGLLILGSGDTTLRFCPPLLIDEEQAEFAVRTVDACITEIERST